LMMAQFELVGTSVGPHPEAPRFHQRGEGSRAGRIHCALYPSLRLKNGAQDDASEYKSRNSSK
jgi:hypothetical protein